MKHDEELKCVKCSQFAKPTTLKIDGYAIRGWSCKCGEQYLHPEDAEWLLLAKKTEKEKITAKVTKIGNSYSIRIPKDIVTTLKLAKRALTLRIEPGKVEFVV